MFTSTRQSSCNSLCRNLHSLAIAHPIQDEFTGQVYADMLWSNRPEKGSPG